jgi:hypothetical protein
MMKNVKNRMMVFMSKRMIACDEASYLVSYQHENRLGFRKWLRLKMHLLSCHLCRKYESQIEQLNHALDQYREKASHEPCQHHLSQEAGLKIQHALSKELNGN